MPDIIGCKHPETRFIRVPFSLPGGREGFCVEEVCLDCHANVRGPGKWMPRDQVPGDPEKLPTLADLFPPPDGRRWKDTQLDLFDKDFRK